MPSHSFYAHAICFVVLAVLFGFCLQYCPLKAGSDVQDCVSSIKSRKSIRKFDEAKSISEEDMKTIIECGMSAPSAMNERSSHFVVVRDQAIRDKLADFYPYAQFIRDPTAVAVLVCSETSKLIIPEYWQQDCGAATENMLVAAASMGIGSTWSGVFPMQESKENEVRAILGIPDGIKVFNIIGFGYPDGTSLTPRESRFDAARFHNDKW